jgi:hypothetical protein
MLHLNKLSSGLVLGLCFFSSVKAQFPPLSVCTEGQCDDCPQSVTSGGTGYPDCVVYSSADVFASGDYNKTDGGYVLRQPSEISLHC